MTYALTWLAQVLRDDGLKVVEEPGWLTRGHGDIGVIRGVICHHTAGPRSGNDPDLHVVRDGRSDLAGPLAQLFLARDGIFHVVAAGLSYHAGAGKWKDVVNGNQHFVGIEAENTGLADDQPWPEVQMAAYAGGVAALLKHIKAPVDWCIGHKEWALPKGRKSDPSFDMDIFRKRVSAFFVSPSGVHPAPAPAAASSAAVPTPPRAAASPAGTQPPPVTLRTHTEIGMAFLQGATFEGQKLGVGDLPAPLSKVGAAALLGNAMQESYARIDTTAVGDHGTAYGMFQWHSDRQAAMRAFAKYRGLSADSLIAQIAFAMHELATTEKIAGDALRRATTVEDATKAAIGYERPRGWSAEHPENGDGYANRLKNAKSLL